MDDLTQKAIEQSKQAAKNAVKTALKNVGRAIWSAILPVLPWIILGVVLFIVIIGCIDWDGDDAFAMGMISADTDYVVKIDDPNSAPVITDINKLKEAFSGYPTNSKLIANAQTFLNMQNTYKVNAIFAAAVAIQETTAGTNGTYAVDGHNWFNYVPISGISDLDGYLGTQGRWCKWDTDAHGIMGLGYYISQHGSCYFSQGEYTVSEIGSHYCDPPEEWIKGIKSYMYDMYRAAGFELDLSGTPGKTGITTVSGVEVKTYTSSFGRTYIMFDQTKGPWASLPYHGSTVGKIGCPTTASATAATGLGVNCTPRDFLGFYTQGLEFYEIKTLMPIELQFTLFKIMLIQLIKIK